MGREWLNCWHEKLEYSLSSQQDFDIEILKNHIPSCVSVKKTDVATDKTGVDYIATLKNGAVVFVDAKTRTSDCAKFWVQGEPELALEKWSIVDKKVGWTLSTSSAVDYILFTFDKEVCDRFFFIPFQLLRKAFLENGKKWQDKYGLKYQSSYSCGRYWRSAAIFVPASVVVQAVRQTMIGECIN